MSEMNEEYDFSGSLGADVARESGNTGNFAREVEYFALKGDPASVHQGLNQGIYRILTEYEAKVPPQEMTKYTLPWISALQHYAPTKPKPEYVKKESNWPSKMGAGCRKDKIFAKKFGGVCFLCDQVSNKPSSRTFALAVEREPVVQDGRIVGYRDKTREVFDRNEKGEFIVLSDDGQKKTYQTKVVPAFVIMSMGWRNFFQGLSGQASYFKTAMDADYLITRMGEGTSDTSYAFVRVGEMMLPEGNPYGLPGGTKYDLSIPGLMEKVYPNLPDLRQIIANRVSDDVFGRYFIPGWTPPGYIPGQGQSHSQTSGQMSGQMMMSPQQAPGTPQGPQGGNTSAEPSSEALEVLRRRVLASQGGGNS